MSLVPVPVNLSTPAAPNQTINYSGPLTASAGTLPHGVNGVTTYSFYGQGIVINNLTAAWDLSARTRMSLTYRYSTRNIGQGVPHKGEVVETDPVSGEITIVENAGVFNVAMRPASNWEINGTVEMSYSDNALTPIGPRQFKQYRFHTMYRPKTWATINGAYQRSRAAQQHQQQRSGYFGDANRMTVRLTTSTTAALAASAPA